MNGEPIVILLVEDDDAHAEIVVRNFEDSHLANTMFRVAEEGKPTGFGLLLHAGVFFAVTLGLMYV